MVGDWRHVLHDPAPPGADMRQELGRLAVVPVVTRAVRTPWPGSHEPAGVKPATILSWGKVMPPGAGLARWPGPTRRSVYVVAQVAARFTTRVFIFTDSQYVEHGLSALRGGAPSVGKDADVRSVVRRAAHKVAGVRWVKAHLSVAEATARGIRRSGT